MSATDPKPCKCCGTCPTCGHRPQPVGTWPWPTYPWPTYPWPHCPTTPYWPTVWHDTSPQWTSGTTLNSGINAYAVNAS